MPNLTAQEQLLADYILDEIRKLLAEKPAEKPSIWKKKPDSSST